MLDIWIVGVDIRMAANRKVVMGLAAWIIFVFGVSMYVGAVGTTYVTPGYVITDYVLSTYINGTAWYSGSSNRTDVMAYPVGAYNYIVFQVGSNFLAKNGTTGVIEYGSTDLGTVVNLCMRDYVSILIVGRVSTSNTIVVDHPGVVISGLGKNNTKITMATSNKNIFNVTAPYFTLKDMSIDGNRGSVANATAVYEYHTYLCRYENLQIVNCGQRGIYIDCDGVSGGYRITGSQIVGCGYECILVAYGVDGWIVENDLGGSGRNVLSMSGGACNTIMENKIYYGGWNGSAWQHDYGIGLMLWDEVQDTVIGNSIRMCSLDGLRVSYVRNATIANCFVSLNDQARDGWGGINIDESNFTVVSNCVTGNYEGSGSTYTQYFGLDIGAECDYIIASGIMSHSNLNSEITNLGNASNCKVVSSMNGSVWVS